MIALNEAEVLLDRYRRLMATGFPFIVLPDNQNAETLREERPVLMQAIGTVTMFHDLPRQQALVKDLVKEFGERILMKNEKSIDILQGILIFVAWSYPHVFWCQQVTNLLHLAIAMVLDMSIDRLWSNHDFKSAAASTVHGPALTSRVPSLDERRTLLGLFYIASMLLAKFKRFDVLPFTDYMEECLAALEQAQEHDSDLCLVQMVRIQREIVSIHTTETHNAPPRLYVKAFQTNLERLRKADPCSYDNLFLRLHYASVDILAWETSLNMLQENKNRPLSSHLDDLWNLIAGIKAFVDLWFSIPPSAYLLLPFSVFSQFARTFICLTRLASLEVDGWDVKALNSEIDFFSVVEEAARRFDEASQSAPDGVTVNNDALSKWSAKLHWMKQVYTTKFLTQENEGAAQDAAAKAQASARAPDVGQPTPPEDPTLSAEFFNYLDDNFWTNFGDFDLSMLGGTSVSGMEA